MAISMAYAMMTKLTVALVEMDKKGKIGKMAIKMGGVGIPIGVRIAATTMPTVVSSAVATTAAS
jgi:hypothetical protein